MTSRQRRTTHRGQPCLVGGYAVMLTGATREAEADLRMALSAASAGRPPVDLTLHSHPGGLRRPTRPPDRTVFHMAFWTEGDGEIVSTGPTHVARLHADVAVLDPGTDGVRGIHMLLLPVLALLFSRRSRFLVHAAAYLDADGGGAALGLGGSGQGKSTLIAAALTAGRVVLSDDLVAMRLDDGGEISVSGVPQPLALPGDLHDERVVGAAIEGDRRGRRSALPSCRLDPGWHPLRSVILVGHSTEPDGELTRAQPRDVFFGLLTSTVEGLSEGAVRQVFPVAAAVSGVPAWHIAFASDSKRRVAEATGWLEAIQRSELA